jgi:2,3-bisphosphoglycerate-dependent phosphoglycerate mutase
MAVGFKVKFYWYQIGHGNFLHSFFSTVAYNLENGNWGSRFPIIMNELYQGKIERENIGKAIEELSIIKKELKKLVLKR